MSKLSREEIDEICARNPIAEVASGYVTLRRSGGKLLGPCPMCGGRQSSGRFEVFEKDNSWGCYVGCGGGDVISLVQKAEACDFVTAIERLGGRREVDRDQARRLFEEREKKRLAQEKTAASFREKERKRLFKTWKGAVAIHGTIAASYLEGRGLQLPDRCPGLRYLPSAVYYHGEELDERGRKAPRAIHCGPAMLAAFIRADGTFGGLHMTWLEDYGARLEFVGDEQQTRRLFRKAEITDNDSGEVLPSKKMRGSKTGAHIAISMVDNPKRLVVGEGIETVLSVWTALHQAGRPLADMAFWAAGDLGNLAGRATKTVKHPTLKRPNGHALTVPDRYPDPDDSGLSIPDTVDELILLGDGDSEQLLTECAMERAARRYARPGRAIRIAFAPAGKDFNDVLRGEAA